jgi:hypothetical protein
MNMNYSDPSHHTGQGRGGVLCASGLLVLLRLSLPTAVQAEFTFATNNDSTITIAGYAGPGGAVAIPGRINGLPVVSIGEAAFWGCFRLTSLSIPNSVASIGDGAFVGCSSLAGITLPNGVTSIGDAAFMDCTGLTSITISDSVTSIGDWALAYCGLTNLAIPSSVTNIGNAAFRSCTSLTNLTIGNSLANIGSNACADCTRLAGIYFRGNAPADGGGVFKGSTNATVYYLPGTTGWGSTFSGRPALLWNPHLQTTVPQRSQIRVSITGTPNIPIVAEASAHLPSAAWTSLLSCTLTNGTIYFNDPAWTNYPARFYRVRSP